MKPTITVTPGGSKLGESELQHADSESSSHSLRLRLPRPVLRLGSSTTVTVSHDAAFRSGQVRLVTLMVLDFGRVIYLT